jgi:hypothetical protein
MRRDRCGGPDDAAESRSPIKRREPDGRPADDLKTADVAQG